MTDVLVLASSFNRFAGPNSHLLDLCNCLFQKMDVDLRLLTHKSNFESDFSRCIKFPVTPALAGQSPTHFVRLVNAAPNIKIIESIIRRLEIPLNGIIVNANIDTLLETYVAVGGKRIKTGYNVLYTSPDSLLVRTLDRLAAKRAIGRIIAHTQFHKALFEKLGLRDKDITVIPHSIDLVRLHSMLLESGEKFLLSEETQDRRPVIFYGGRLAVDKGIKELVSCYEEVCKELPATLVLVGTGPMKDWIMQRKAVIERRNKNALLVLFPWQSQAKFLRLMADASIVSVPSHVESFGMVILEAMALSKPVLATCFGGPPEIITHGQDGMIVDPFDTHKLQESMLELLGDAKKRRQMGRNAVKTVQSKFEVTKVAPRFLEFMED